MLARKLKKGMLVRAQPGYVIVIRQFKVRPPGVKDGELGFTVMSPESSRFISAASASKVLTTESPVMYYDTVRTKSGKKSFKFSIIFAKQPSLLILLILKAFYSRN